MIKKSDQLLALLVQISQARAERVPGRGRGQWHVAADFDAPLDFFVVESKAYPQEP